MFTSIVNYFEKYNWKILSIRWKGILKKLIINVDLKNIIGDELKGL